jgi:hypothetical protein
MTCQVKGKETRSLLNFGEHNITIFVLLVRLASRGPKILLRDIIIIASFL